MMTNQFAEEKSRPYPEPDSIPTTLAGENSTIDVNDEKQLGIFRKVTNFLLRWGIETQG